MCRIKTQTTNHKGQSRLLLRSIRVYAGPAAHKSSAQQFSNIPGEEKSSVVEVVLQRLISGTAATVRGIPEAAARFNGS